MKKTTKKSEKKSLFVSTEKVRPITNERMADVAGGMCTWGSRPSCGVDCNSTGG